MARKTTQTSIKFNQFLIDMLCKMKYTVTTEPSRRGWFIPSLAILIPLITAVLSIILMSFSWLFFWATLASVIYKILITFFSYINYSKEVVHNSTKANMPETPFLIRLLLSLSLVFFLVIVVVIYMFRWKDLAFVDAMYLFATPNILLTWFFESTDLLAAIFNAKIPC